MYSHCKVFIDAAVKARCSALSEMSSAIHAIVNGTMLPPIDDTMYKGARWENGPMTGVTARSVNTMMAIVFENSMTGHRRPLRGPSDSHTQVNEYAAVKALPIVGYWFC
jgi:hypothetical protein